MTETLPILLITLGALFLTGLLADQMGRRTRLPRVTLLLACGLLAGRPGFDLIPPEAQQLYDALSVTALTMVAFLLGGALTLDNLARHGRAILLVSAMIVLVTMALVTTGLWLVGMPAPVALLLGAIATATAPAATQDTIRQSGASGPFIDLIKGIVAIDDVWGLIAFSLAAVLAAGLDGAVPLDLLRDAGWEIGGALVLGAAIGLPAAFLTGRLTPGEPMQTEALGIVFLTAGLAVWADVSFLLAGMMAGALVANLASHHDRAFHEIENIQWPFMILFFVLAGASLNVGELAEAGTVGAAFILLRIVARLGGGWLGAVLAGSPKPQRPWFGMALLPQAGVAVGMALIAAREFPDHADLILSLTIGTTVVFELLGPAATLWAIRRVARG
ncbi:cation:proton antiporter [Roseovarius sp. SYSU LYC5161]|uniref:cation:proton antiporter n=1 Tax=Roseovarius halophilus (ex Wu et al. 2025) TaxID=3376060 RepID=UPI002871C57A|nr:cation:proton antiporter [Roseovarius sp.]